MHVSCRVEYQIFICLRVWPVFNGSLQRWKPVCSSHCVMCRPLRRCLWIGVCLVELFFLYRIGNYCVQFSEPSIAVFVLPWYSTVLLGRNAAAYQTKIHNGNTDVWHDSRFNLWAAQMTPYLCLHQGTTFWTFAVVFLKNSIFVNIESRLVFLCEML